MFNRRALAGLALLAFVPAVARAQANPPRALSGTVTTGGTAQTLFSGEIPSGGWEVCNSDATNDLWVSDITTAAIAGAGSYRAAASGGCYVTRGSIYGPISVIGAVTGQKFSARKW